MSWGPPMEVFARESSPACSTIFQCLCNRILGIKVSHEFSSPPLLPLTAQNFGEHPKADKIVAEKWLYFRSAIISSSKRFAYPSPRKNSWILYPYVIFIKIYLAKWEPLFWTTTMAKQWRSYMWWLIRIPTCSVFTSTVWNFRMRYLGKCLVGFELFSQIYLYSTKLLMRIYTVSNSSSRPKAWCLLDP